MQKNITTSENPKQKMLKQIIQNITIADEISVEMFLNNVMDEIPEQTINIRIKKNGNIMAYPSYYDELF